MITRITIDNYYQCNLTEPPNWTVLIFGSFPYQTSPGLIWQWVAKDDKSIPDSIREQRKKLIK